jgi:hypothetical protein
MASRLTVDYIDDSKYDALTCGNRLIDWEDEAIATVKFQRPDVLFQSDWENLNMELQRLAPPGWRVTKLVGNPWNADSNQNNSCKILHSASDYNNVFHTQRPALHGRQYLPRSHQSLRIFVSNTSQGEQTHSLTSLLSRLDRFTSHID